MADLVFKFRARAGFLVQDYESLGARVHRYVGRRFNPDHGPEVHDYRTDSKYRPGGFEPMPEGEEKRVDRMHAPLYGIELRAGCLWPGDQATADAFGVPFDPTFGGEYDAPAAAAPPSPASSVTKPSLKKDA